MLKSHTLTETEYKDKREIDFIKLRQILAEGHEWNDEMHRAISPQFNLMKN